MRRLEEKIIKIGDEDIVPFVNKSLEMIKALGNNQIDIRGLLKEDLVFYARRSTGFKSLELLEAHAIKPIIVQVYIPSLNKSYAHPGYFPKEGLININFENSVIRAYCIHKISKPNSTLPLKEFFRLNVANPEKRWQEFINPQSIYETVYHELSHWYRDVTGDGFLQKDLEGILNKYGSLSPESKDDYYGIHGSSMFVHYEVDAQAHAIFALKNYIENKTPGRWDTMRFSDIFIIMNDSLGHYVQIGKRGIVRKWLIQLWKRLYRENLIGKNMKFSIDEFKKTYQINFDEIFLDYHVKDIDKYRWWDQSTWGLV